MAKASDVRRGAAPAITPRVAGSAEKTAAKTDHLAEAIFKRGIGKLPDGTLSVDTQKQIMMHYYIHVRGYTKARAWMCMMIDRINFYCSGNKRASLLQEEEQIDDCIVLAKGRTSEVYNENSFLLDRAVQLGQVKSAKEIEKSLKDEMSLQDIQVSLNDIEKAQDFYAKWHKKDEVMIQPFEKRLGEETKYREIASELQKKMQAVMQTTQEELARLQAQNERNQKNDKKKSEIQNRYQEQRSQYAKADNELITLKEGLKNKRAQKEIAKKAYVQKKVDDAKQKLERNVAKAEKELSSHEPKKKAKMGEKLKRFLGVEKKERAHQEPSSRDLERMKSEMEKNLGIAQMLAEKEFEKVFANEVRGIEEQLQSKEEAVALAEGKVNKLAKEIHELQENAGEGESTEDIASRIETLKNEIDKMKPFLAQAEKLAKF